MNHPDERILFGTWCAMAVVVVAALVYFRFSHSSADTKRRVFRWYSAIGSVFVAIWFTLLFGIPGLLLALGIMPIATYWALYITRFCDACGATQFNQWSRPRFCAYCGADLNAQEQFRKELVDDKD